MNYLGFLSELSEKPDELSSRARAAMFWVCGEGLCSGLGISSPWRDWIEAASWHRFQYATTGHMSAEGCSLESQAMDLSNSEELSQHQQSVVGCYMAVLSAGSGSMDRYDAQFVIFPLMESESIRLFEDISLGDDEQEDEAFQQPRVQQAARFMGGLVEALLETPGPTAEFVNQLRQGAEVISPCAGYEGLIAD